MATATPSGHSVENAFVAKSSRLAQVSEENNGFRHRVELGTIPPKEKRGHRDRG